MGAEFRNVTMAICDDGLLRFLDRRASWSVTEGVGHGCQYLTNAIHFAGQFELQHTFG